jgi:hypothetical protein
MPRAISNTSPLLYLHRIEALEWLPRLFEEFWAPTAVVAELEEGRQYGYGVPDFSTIPSLRASLQISVLHLRGGGTLGSSS